jgi:serine/threonine-protein kinase
MGVVYQGFDPIIGRTVAIKTMLTEGLAPAEFEDFKARFQREAQAAGILNHPNIVTVYDFGEDSGVLYLAMEFLEGRSLQDIVEEEGVLPVERIIPIYEQVCGALDLAHTHKIIHRDVKPANIMILNSGIVKMTDFGIAKMLATGMTQAGQILGTPNYMSPEQVRGRQIDGRSDIFSLGVILYELVTGEKPFGGQNITTVIYRIINENPIPPRELDSTIHPGLSYVIQKALAKSPEERYQTCREFADDLKNYRKLGGAIAPSETVVVRVPPIGATLGETRPTPAVKPVLDVRLTPQAPARPAPPPPVQPAPSQSSAATWILVILLLAGALGGGYYYMFMRAPAATETTQTPAPQSPPATQSAPATNPSQPQATGEAGTPTQPGAQPGDANVGTGAAAPGAPASSAPTGATAQGQSAGTAAATHPPDAKSTTQTTARAESSVSPRPSGGGAKPSQGPGSLVVTANVPGATVTLDGKPEMSGAAPFSVQSLSPGVHSVAVTKEGYNGAQRSITVEAGKSASLSVELTVPAGEINIETIPSGIETLIDGQLVGKTPVQKPAGVGRHTYTLRGPGKNPYAGNFEIKHDGYILTRRIDLAGAAAAPTGIVEVRTTPPGATVLADGNPADATTPTSFRLNRGLHRLTISLSGYATINKDVEVPADGTISINEQLSQ